MTKLTQSEINALRAAFHKASPVPVKAADQFYDNVLEADPTMKGPYFLAGGPPKTMMWMTLRLIVDNAEQLSQIDAPLRNLGARHVGFGAKPENYGMFADVLIGTIATIYGDDWTDTHETAWEKALGHAVTQMLMGAAKAEADAAAGEEVEASIEALHGLQQDLPEMVRAAS